MSEDKELQFYNYQPKIQELKTKYVSFDNVKSIEAKLDAELEEEIKNAFKGNVLDQISAKEINADLKRELQGKLNLLSKKTNQAILELIRKEIKEKVHVDNQTKPTEETNEAGNNNNIPTNVSNESNNVTNVEDETVQNNEEQFDQTKEKNIGYLLYESMNKLEEMEESD